MRLAHNTNRAADLQPRGGVVNTMTHWGPVAILSIGALFTVGIDTQRSLPLRAPLESVVPVEIAGRQGTDVSIEAAELEAAGVTSHLMRNYANDSDTRGPRWSVYIGYYDRQVQGKSIHSPKNCLPGAGWEALASSEVAIPAATGTIAANRYLLQKDEHQALVLYWYQGRGRAVANEYLVKVNLLRDAALRQRSEEALVRIVVPIQNSEEEAFEIARDAAKTVAPSLALALPS